MVSSKMRFFEDNFSRSNALAVEITLRIHRINESLSWLCRCKFVKSLTAIDQGNRNKLKFRMKGTYIHGIYVLNSFGIQERRCIRGQVKELWVVV